VTGEHSEWQQVRLFTTDFVSSLSQGQPRVTAVVRALTRRVLPASGLRQGFGGGHNFEEPNDKIGSTNLVRNLLASLAFRLRAAAFYGVAATRLADVSRGARRLDLNPPRPPRAQPRPSQSALARVHARRPQRCPRCCDQEGDRGDRARGVDQKALRFFRRNIPTVRTFLECQSPDNDGSHSSPWRPA
jgi:hypothetical protein